MSTVTSFLVETYTPATTSVATTESRLQRAAAGTPVHYAQSIFVPEDEVCFYLFDDAPSAESVDAIIRSSGIVPQRIMRVRV